MKKTKTFLLVVVFSFTLLATNFAGNIRGVPFEDNNLNILNSPRDAADHAPISIDGNGELATFIENENLSGNGTYDFPYIIENFTINASTAHGIEIKNTDAYLIIRDCIVEEGKILGSGGYRGIFIFGTGNINISNNVITNSYIGIYLQSSTNTVLSGNFVSDCLSYGIHIYDSPNCTVSGNFANYNGFTGIGIAYNCDNSILTGNYANYNGNFGINLGAIDNCTLSGNIANYNRGGIVLSDCDNNILTGNYADYNINYGINLGNSYNCTLSKNYANYNAKFGISISYHSDKSILTGNYANYNGWSGISVERSHNNLMEANNASYNEGKGILLRDSTNNTLSRNFLCYNNLPGISVEDASHFNTIYLNDIYWNSEGAHRQAFEGASCIDNKWDNGTHGNFWGSAYTRWYPNAHNDGTRWDIPFMISEIGNDYFPLVYSIHNPDFEAPVFISAPEDFQVQKHTVGPPVSWLVTDFYPSHYYIEENGIIIVPFEVGDPDDYWENGIEITYNINIDGQPHGHYVKVNIYGWPHEHYVPFNDYNLTIFVMDASGNVAQDTVIFTVVPYAGG